MRKNDRLTSSLRRLNRRRFIELGAAALVYPLLSRMPCFAAPVALPPDRFLSFFNTHTTESGSVEYCQAGCLLTPSLDKIDYLLRDHRSGEIKSIDVRLLFRRAFIELMEWKGWAVPDLEMEHMVVTLP